MKLSKKQKQEMMNILRDCVSQGGKNGFWLPRTIHRATIQSLVNKGLISILDQQKKQYNRHWKDPFSRKICVTTDVWIEYKIRINKEVVSHAM